MSTDKVNYKVIGVRKKVLETVMEDYCYYDLIITPINRSAVKIITFPKIKDTPYTEEQCKRWLEAVNNMGFPCSYYKKDTEYHYFEIPLRKGRKVFYKDKLHLMSTLILVRYLWERGINSIPKAYFDIKEALPEEDDFYLMQMAHPVSRNHGGYGNTNHTLRDFRLRSFISKEELFSKMKYYGLFNSGRPAMTVNWTKEEIQDKNVDRTNYRELFNRLK